MTLPSYAESPLRDHAMRTLRTICAAILCCGLGLGIMSVSGGCDSSPGDGSQVTLDASAKQQAQERGEKMKALMATKTARPGHKR